MNHNYFSKELSFAFENPFIYKQTFSYSHQTKLKKKIKQVKLLGPQINRNDYEVKQIFAPSHDGEDIPINLFYKKGALSLNRRNRVIMEGYGAYGIPMPQHFNFVNLAAMERGWVLAQAMVRGGGERGQSWHE